MAIADVVMCELLKIGLMGDYIDQQFRTDVTDSNRNISMCFSHTFLIFLL